MGKTTNRVLNKKNFALDVLNGLPTMIAILDVKSLELVDVNKAFLKYFEKKSIKSFKKEYSCVCDAFEKTDNQEYLTTELKDVKLVYKFLEKGGSIKVQMRGHVFKLLGHRVGKKRIAALFIDITDLEEQKQFADEYKKIVDASSIVSKADLREHITYVNDKFCEISGYSKDELIGAHHLIVSHPSVNSDIFKEMFEKIQNKKMWNGEVSNRSKDGSEYIVDFTVAPIMDKSGNIVEFMGVGKDITEQVLQSRKLKELQASKMKENIKVTKALCAQDVVNAIALPSLILDTEDSIESYNEAFLDLFDMFADNEAIEKIQEKVLDIGIFFQYANQSIQDGALLDWKEERLESGLIDDNIVELPIAGELIPFEIYINRLSNEENRFLVVLHREHK